MSYYLFDHPNPHGPHYHAQRRGRILGVVIHITAGAEDVDLDPVDRSAENTAAYAASTDRAVSWHAGADTDGVVDLLPDTAVAFHVIGYNTVTLGIEISKRDTDWSDMPDEWVRRTLWHAARKVRAWCDAHGIPRRVILDRARIDRHIAAGRAFGITGHATLDPARRSDPGANFPWSTFLAMVERPTSLAGAPRPPAAPKPSPPKPTPKPSTDWTAQLMAKLPTVSTKSGTKAQVRRVQALLVAAGYTLAVDGIVGPITTDRIRKFQTKAKLDADGIVGPRTWPKLLGV